VAPRLLQLVSEIGAACRKSTDAKLVAHEDLGLAGFLGLGGTPFATGSKP